MLLVWSDVLQEANRQTKVQRSLDLIAQDVVALVSGELSREAVKRQRYERFLDPEQVD